MRRRRAAGRSHSRNPAPAGTRSALLSKHDLPRWTDLGGNAHVLRARLVDATTVEQVQDAVRTRSGRVRALGTRHSFHDLADTDGTLITVTGIDPAPVLDEGVRTVTAGAGVRYGELAVWLEERGWALHNLGSLPHISIGGATATGTHGSGDRLGTLSTAVRALEYVGADGELRRARRVTPTSTGTSCTSAQSAS